MLYYSQEKINVWSLFDKRADLKTCKETPTHVFFSVNIIKILRTTFCRTTPIAASVK